MAAMGQESASDLVCQLAQAQRELAEAREQQTAISDILRVISNSPGDVQPALHSVAEHAARICEAQIVDIIIVENNEMHVDASFGELTRPVSMPLDRSTVSGRSICDLQPVHVADLQNASDEFARGREYALKFGHRSILAVPLIREGRALGTILVRRTQVRPFEQKHIALLTTFADQAAIAIENVRLFEAEQAHPFIKPSADRGRSDRSARACCVHRALGGRRLAVPSISSCLPCDRISR